MSLTGLGACVLLLALGSGCAGPGDPASRRPGEGRVDAAGIEQVWVPAGTFRMGTDAASLEALQAQAPPWVRGELPSESPQHGVTLTHGFWIDRDEVSNRAFQAFVDAGGYGRRELWSDEGWSWLQERGPAAQGQPCEGDLPRRPRACVSWFEAEACARWRGGRLPTEAEWEFAARGPTSRVYPWGDTWDYARCNVVDSASSAPPGSFPRGESWVGARDMAGNVMEWVSDWLDVGYYAQCVAQSGEHGTTVDPAGPPTGTVKVEKGGWWGSNAVVARCAYRHFEDPPTYGDKHIGFRVVSP